MQFSPARRAGSVAAAAAHVGTVVMPNRVPVLAGSEQRRPLIAPSVRCLELEPRRTRACTRSDGAAQTQAKAKDFQNPKPSSGPGRGSVRRSVGCVRISCGAEFKDAARVLASAQGGSASWHAPPLLQRCRLRRRDLPLCLLLLAAQRRGTAKLSAPISHRLSRRRSHAAVRVRLTGRR